MRSIFSICLLFTTAVSVFGEPQKLNGIVGKSIEFPAAVKIDGKLMHSGVLLGDVTDRKFKRGSNVEYTSRVNWDSNTGYFSLSGLRLKDSGVYTVENTDGQTSVSTFNLTVWEDYVPVSKPIIKFTSNKYPCYLHCTMDRGTGVNMSWYRVGEKDHHGDSNFLDPPYLQLSLRVHKDGIYTCEGKNPVSNETSDPLTVGAHCTGGAAGIWQTEGSKMWSLCLVLIVMLYSHLV